MAVKNYGAKYVTVIVGPHIVSGASDDYVSISYNNESYTYERGIDSGTRVAMNDDSARVTISLQQTSSSNDYFSGLYLLDKASNGGVVPILIKDQNGRSLYAGAEAWIEKIPDSDFKKDLSNREWVFQVDELIPFVGGNG